MEDEKPFGGQTLSEFMDKISSSSPTPGGGTVSAFTGALAAALVMMVCNLTIGKKRYKNAEAYMCDLRNKAEAAREELMNLAVQDACAFEAVMTSRSDPEKYQDALKQATEVPYQVAQSCVEVMKMAGEAFLYGNKNASSDALVAMELSRAAIRGAIANVRINLNEITDLQFKARINAHSSLFELFSRYLVF